MKRSASPSSSRSRFSVTDAAGVSISSLCIIHCLALPVLAATLPIAGVWAEAEWVHKMLVLTAIPVAGYAVFSSGAQQSNRTFLVLVTLGLSLLVTSAFVEALHDYETVITTIGAILVAAAHIWRWLGHRQ